MAHCFVNSEKELHRIIEDCSDKWIAFLKVLTCTPSILGSESECQDMVRKKMQELEIYETDVKPSCTPPYHNTKRLYENRTCVIGKLSSKLETSQNFILNAHIDTAPVEDPSSWDQPPFSGTVRDGYLYGRGVLDDKAGIAMMLMLADVFKKASLTLPFNLIFESVIEDEDSGNGTLACTEAGYLCEGAIVIDGTWPFRIIDAHLGQVWVDMTFRGVPAAACSMRRAKNPIETAYKAMNAMNALDEDIASKYSRWNDIDRPCFVNFGSIHSGAWAGAVPEKCTISFQMGFPPPYTPDEILGQMKHFLNSAGLFEHSDYELSLGTLATPPFENRNNPIVIKLRDTIARLHPDSKYTPLSVAVMGHCDLRHFKTPEHTIAPACLYGPGGGGNPHANNEFYMLEHFVPVAKNIASAILTC